MMKNNVRNVALTILDDVLTGEAYSNLQLNEAIKTKPYLKRCRIINRTCIWYFTKEKSL